MKLEDLVGLKWLSGVEYDHWETDRSAIYFTLNDITYVAMEDDNDGYRSAMEEIKLADNVIDEISDKVIRSAPKQLQNRFKPVQVLCVMRLYGRDGCYILDCYDVITGKLVLSIGTDNTDDYYPSFVSDFYPENMVINQ
jgi:hypothetical protein